MRERERAGDAAAASPPERRPESLPLETLLAAGNQAVARLLARAPEAKPKEAPAATGTRATVPGVGVIPLESVSWPGGRPRPPAGRGNDREAPPPVVDEISVTSLHGQHSPALYKAALDGKAADVEIVIVSQSGSLTIKLKGAMVSSYSTGAGEPPVESWTLNFTGIEFEHSAQEKEGAPGRDGPGAQWDYGER